MFVKFVLALAWLACSLEAQSGVIINTTRVIYSEADGEATIQLSNKGKGPVLAQLWVDAGDAKANPSEIDLPFALTPAVSRIDPERGQAVRILRTRDDLPKDRESVFWFNLLEIPPKPTKQLAQGDNVLQFALRTRIKMFYRPQGLVGSAQQAHEQLRFVLEPAAADGARTLLVSNPSAYHITFHSLQVQSASDAPAWGQLGRPDSRMVAPQGELRLPLKLTSPQAAAPQGAQVFYGVINDYGGVTQAQQVLEGVNGQ